ncbi:MAG TPA: helix-turn-helix domain-containing protein [Actinomycetes bacterium]|nr:helix-turn-helix domain-containing protein [Actinomycetes bacterium]
MANDVTLQRTNGVADVTSGDLITLGRRVRHLRRARGLTLEQLAAEVQSSPSQLSLLENGRREPRLSLLQNLAAALGVSPAELLGPEPPSRRAALEIALERAQRGPAYAALGLPAVRPGARLPTDALEALVGLHAELARQAEERSATPEEARRANAELRLEMRARDNYFEELERAAADLCAVAPWEGPLSQRALGEMAAHLGYSLVRVDDLPESTRSVVDLENRRVYLPQSPDSGGTDLRALALQALGHVVLGHTVPSDYAEFLRQRVETNYFSAAILVPERRALELLRRSAAAKDVAIEDLRDAFAVSYETAAHRFTNLATRHLGIPVHFMRVHESGTIYKAYENDGVHFPTDVTGAIEGQRACRQWTARQVFAQPDKSIAYAQYTDTPSGTYWCTALTEQTPAGEFSVSVGVPYAHVKWFRGRETTERAVSRCPDERCCRRAPEHLAARWSGRAWPSARIHSHLLAAMPPGTFPGVDDTEVYSFLESRAG